jgi:nicotinamide-nucleotide amidase
MLDDELETLARKVGDALLAAGAVLVTAESCTGGWVGAAITAIPGSSRWFDRGFITYSNSAKRDVLSVSAETLKRHGAVSEETAREMALGALKHSKAKISLAITGVAGPDGGTAEKPVGTVCFAWAKQTTQLRSTMQRLSGDRNTVRRQSVVIALQGVLDLLATAETAMA